MEINHQIHVMFFPFMAHGHIIPIIDMAKLFSSRGHKTTIITTHFHAPLVSKTVERTQKDFEPKTKIHVINFPANEVGLPEGYETMDRVTKSFDMFSRFLKAMYLLQGPVEQILQEISPDCLVADMFFPWATDAAAKFSIPRLVFHGLSLFSLCVSENLRFYKPFKNVSSDSEPFVLPHFPHEVEFSKGQIPEFEIGESESIFMNLLKELKETEARCFGIVVNSFDELEKDYVDYFSKVWKKRSWLVGPISLCNKRVEDKAQRGKKSSIDEEECLKWLDSKKENSVIYVCFGSMAPLSDSQLHEIALGLEASRQDFIWVVKKSKQNDADDGEKWMPKGFEERVKDKGLIIRGWAPQVLILEHESTGAFMTHCGWNSTLESVCGGVAMLTWPMFAEQPFNEKLLTQVLKIGRPVGSPLLNRGVKMVKSEEVADAVKWIMEHDEGVEMRSRAKGFKEIALKAIEDGGSSYNNLNCLIQEIRAYHSRPKHI